MKKEKKKYRTSDLAPTLNNELGCYWYGMVVVDYITTLPTPYPFIKFRGREKGRKVGCGGVLWPFVG